MKRNFEKYDPLLGNFTKFVLISRIFEKCVLTLNNLAKYS